MAKKGQSSRKKLTPGQLVEKFQCSRCKQWKKRGQFKTSYNQCKECYRLYSDTSKLVANCPECKRLQQLDINGLCKYCNAKFGLKQCVQCQRLLFLWSDFASTGKKTHRRCLDCAKGITSTDSGLLSQVLKPAPQPHEVILGIGQ